MNQDDYLSLGRYGGIAWDFQSNFLLTLVEVPAACVCFLHVLQIFEGTWKVPRRLNVTSFLDSEGACV